MAHKKADITKVAINLKDVAAGKKVPLHFFPPVGVIYGALACKEGAGKYGPFSWREKPISLVQHLSALRRHILAALDGQWRDPNGADLPHLAKVVATAAIILDANSVGKLINDLPPPGKAAEILDKYEVKK